MEGAMKNPWLSLWLSGANAWTGAARGLWAAEAQRAQTAMLDQTVRQAAAFWLPWAQLGEAAASRPKRSRRR
jgi:hypothetical protein